VVQSVQSDKTLVPKIKPTIAALPQRSHAPVGARSLKLIAQGRGLLRLGASAEEGLERQRRGQDLPDTSGRLRGLNKAATAADNAWHLMSTRRQNLESFENSHKNIIATSAHYDLPSVPVVMVIHQFLELVASRTIWYWIAALLRCIRSPMAGQTVASALSKAARARLDPIAVNLAACPRQLPTSVILVDAARPRRPVRGRP
jgi:hypothetical protein